jgi:hypothetical protein
VWAAAQLDEGPAAQSGRAAARAGGVRAQFAGLPVGAEPSGYPLWQLLTHFTGLIVCLTGLTGRHVSNSLAAATDPRSLMGCRERHPKFSE